MRTHRYPQSISLCVAVAVAALSYSVSPQAQPNPGFYQIKLYAIGNLDIRDRQGSVLKPLSPFAGMVLRNTVEYDPGDDVLDLDEERRQHPDRMVFNSPHDISFPVKKANHEIRFRTTDSKLMLLEIRKGSGFNEEDADLLIIYGNAVELGIRPDVNARINFTPTSVGDLQIDADGNGTYETTIRPRLSAVGQLAKDQAAPKIKMMAALSGNNATITASATDAGVGLKDIRYQIGERNPIQPYTGPFEVDTGKGEVLVIVFARDRAGNESAEFKYFEAGREKVGYDPHNLRGRPSGVGSPKTVPNNSPGTGTDPFQLKSKPE